MYTSICHWTSITKFILLIAATINSGYSEAQSVRYWIPTTDRQVVQLGQGYDSTMAKVLPTICVTGDASRQDGVDRQSGRFTYITTNSLDEAHRFLSTAAEISLGFGDFGGGASSQLSMNRSYSKYIEHLIVSNEIRLPATTLTNIRLSKKGQKALKGGMANFVTQCGDRFVISSQFGAIFTADLAAESHKDNEQQEIKTALEAAGAGNGVSASGSQSSIERLNAMKNSNLLKVTMVRMGPGESYPIGSVGEIIEYARNFPTRIGNRSWLVGVEASSYDALIKGDRNSEEKYNYMKLQAKIGNQMNEAINGIAYMLNNPNEFGPFNHEKANNEYLALERGFNDLKSTTLSCLRQNVLSCLPSKEYRRSIPARAKEKSLNPTFEGEEYIDESRQDQFLVLDFKGVWYADCKSGYIGTRYGPYDRTNLIHFTNLTTGTRNSFLLARPTKVPPNTRVGWWAHDSNRTDNCTPPAPSEQNLRAFIFEPLYPDDYTY